MIGIVAFIAVFIVTYQVYKTAKSTERNPWLWAGISAVAGFGLQIVLPFALGFFIAIYYVVTGMPADRVGE